MMNIFCFVVVLRVFGGTVTPLNQRPPLHGAQVVSADSLKASTDQSDSSQYFLPQSPPFSSEFLLRKAAFDFGFGKQQEEMEKASVDMLDIERKFIWIKRINPFNFTLMAFGIVGAVVATLVRLIQHFHSLRLKYHPMFTRWREAEDLQNSSEVGSVVSINLLGLIY